LVTRDDIRTQVPMTGQAYTALDEHPIHQASETFALAGRAEPEWFEHDVYYVFPPGFSDRPYFLVWFQFKPNQDQLQAWVMMNDGVTQHNLVLARSLTVARAELRAGPLSVDVQEPLRRYRLELRPDVEIPFAFDCELEARSAPKLFDKRVYREPHAHFEVEHVHTDQTLMVRRGRLVLNGVTFDLGDSLAYRDKCWGRRAGPHRDRGFHMPLAAQFADRTLSMWYEETIDGTPLYAVGHIVRDKDGRSIDLVGFEHDVTFDPASGDFTSNRWTLLDADGERHEFAITRLLPGGYQRYSETSGERLHHSGAAAVRRSGPLTRSLQTLAVAGEDFDPAWSKEQRQQYCAFTLDGQTGYGITCCYVSPRHARYGWE
jgi:hypothetical protein